MWVKRCIQSEATCIQLFFTCDENRSLSTEGKLAVVVWLDFFQSFPISATVWDKLTCSQPSRMQKLLYVMHISMPVNILSFFRFVALNYVNVLSEQVQSTVGSLLNRSSHTFQSILELLCNKHFSNAALHAPGHNDSGVPLLPWPITETEVWWFSSIHEWRQDVHTGVWREPLWLWL